MSSFMADMEAFTLYEKTETISPRKAVEIRWEAQDIIFAALYEDGAYAQTATARFSEMTHHGVTYRQGIQPGKHKLVAGEREFVVLQALRNGPKTVLTLKEVSTDV